MAIGWARAAYKSRSAGGNAVRSAAYNGRTELVDERTNERFDFRSKARAGDVHLGVLLPVGAKAEFSDSATLWNAAEQAERRKDSQVAREVVIALPKELGREDHIALARSFAETHFVSKGLACQVDIHAPDADDVNWHAHILITTRRVTAEGLDKRKARDLDPAVVTAKGRAKVASDDERWGKLWAAHQDEYFKAQGLDLRVDQTGAVSQQHLGPKRFRAPEAQSARDERAEAEARTLTAWRDPDTVLDLMTRTRSTVTTADLDRELEKALPVDEERDRVRAAVLAHPSLVRLRDRDGAQTDRFTTVAVLDQERRALADAEQVARFRHRVGAREVAGALANRTMRPDQIAACQSAWSGAGLVVIEGRAGVGKSYAIGGIAEAYQKSGCAVVGLGPTNLVGLELAADPHISRGGTIHSELWHVEQGKRTWDARTVVIIDEAAMVDSKTLGRVLHEAAKSGAKLILVGDDRQLASVERGGLFTVLRERYGSAVIEKVTRQRVDWQRDAAEDLAAGRHDRAVQAFAAHGCVRWTETQDEARAALVAQWAADTAGRPEKSRFVFAYTNDDVDALNADLRSVRLQRGELGDGHALATDRGVRDFAVGDRVQITRTDKKLGMTNGVVGTITSIRQGHVIMRLDNGQQIGWHVSQFGGFRHGYAGTIYKGQGRTIDETYLYHSRHWRSAASYVALTRQRDSALVFAATETAKDTAALAKQMARTDDRKAASAYVPEAEWLKVRAQEAAAAKVAEAQAAAERASAQAAAQEQAQRAAVEARAQAEAQHRERVSTYAGAAAEANNGDFLAVAQLVAAQEQAQQDTPEGRAISRALDEAPGARAYLARMQAAKAPQERSHAPVPNAGTAAGRAAPADSVRDLQGRSLARDRPAARQTGGTPRVLPRHAPPVVDQRAPRPPDALRRNAGGERPVGPPRTLTDFHAGRERPAPVLHDTVPVLGALHAEAAGLPVPQTHEDLEQWAILTHEGIESPQGEALWRHAVAAHGRRIDAQEAARKAQEQPAVPAAPAPPPKPQTAPTPRPAPRETLDAMLARLAAHRRVTTDTQSTLAQRDAARRTVADIPPPARPLVHAARADSGMPEPWRARLEAAVTAPTMLERAHALRALAADLAKTEKLASRWRSDRYRLEQDAGQATQKASEVSAYLDQLLQQASRDPAGDRRVIDRSTRSQIEAQRATPSTLVSALRGGGLVGREERRQAQEAAQHLVTAALHVRETSAAAKVAAHQLRQWDATSEAQTGAVAYEQSQAANTAVGAGPLDASYRLNEAAEAFEQQAPAHELQAAEVPDEYRRAVFQQQQESARGRDYGPSQ